MKLFTKETLTHISLYWLGVARRDRGRLGGGRGGGESFFLECASQARLYSKEGKSIGGHGGREKKVQASTLKRDTGGLPCLHPSRKEA